MQSQFDAKKAPSVEKAKAKRIFMEVEEKKMKQMQQMMQNPQQNADPMQAMMDVMIESSKLNDEMFFEHGIEEEDFNAAVIHYNLQDDPEVRAMLMRNMQAMGMGGGMGGGMFGR